MRFKDPRLWPGMALIGLIRLYAYAMSPFSHGTCRFHPTCSAYGMAAIRAHGALKGSALTLRRILRCHPYNKADRLDPVPQNIDWAGIIRYKRRDCTGCARKGPPA